MDDVESERSFSRKKRKLTTRQGVVIGVATVAGLGLVTKLFSFLRRDSKQPKNLSEAELETLEAVLSGDAAKSPLPPPKFANLEPDSDDGEPVDHYNNKDAAVYVPTTDSATQDVVDAAKTQPETPHFQHPSEENHENGDAVELIPGEDEGKPSIEDAVNNMHHLSEEDAHPMVDSVEAHTKVPVHSDEAHTTVPVHSDEAHTTVPVHSDEAHTTVPVDSEEAHTTVPVDSEEAHTTVPVDNEEAHTTIPVDSEEAHTIDREEAYTTVPDDSEESHTMVPVDSEEANTTIPVHSEEAHTIDREEAYTTVPVHSDEAHTIVDSEEAHSKYSEDSEKDGEKHAIEDVEKLKHDSEDAEVEDVEELPSEQGSNKQANGGSWEHGKVVSDDKVKQQDDAEKVSTEENVGSLQVEPEIIKETGKVSMAEGEGNHKSEYSVEAHNSVDAAEKLE